MYTFEKANWIQNGNIKRASFFTWVIENANEKIQINAIWNLSWFFKFYEKIKSSFCFKSKSHIIHKKLLKIRDSKSWQPPLYHLPNLIHWNLKFPCVTSTNGPKSSRVKILGYIWRHELILGCWYLSYFLVMAESYFFFFLAFRFYHLFSLFVFFYNICKKLVVLLIQ